MNPPFIPSTGACLLLCLAQADAGEIAKLPNSTALNLRGSWDGGAVPVLECDLCRLRQGCAIFAKAPRQAGKQGAIAT